MRTDPRPDAGELDLLAQYLDYQRETVLLKTDGLDRAQMSKVAPPSDLTLSGLLNHLSLVEDTWIQERFLGQPEGPPWSTVDWDADPDWEFRTATELEPEELRQRYRHACERNRAAVLGASGPEQMSVRALSDGQHFSLRWVLLHLIEETARHAGHADFLREAIDGVVGE